MLTILVPIEIDFEIFAVKFFSCGWNESDNNDRDID